MLGTSRWTTANDLSATFAYNPASQIVSTVRTGDNYAYTDHANVNVTGTANGLNQLTQVGAKALTHDERGNVTMFGTRSFTYNAENQLLTGPNSTTLSYDPAMRLYQTVAGTATVRMAYDGLDRIAEYAPPPAGGADIIQRRYVFGPGIDQPLVWYEGSGTSDRRFLSSDERGSIISVTDSSGAVLAFNRYDEYGNPQGTNLGVWGYTGQAWLPGMGGWYYKARVYDRELGRFLQTDPIGYWGGLNLYTYVWNDPVNFVDPLGFNGCSEQADVCGDPGGIRVFIRSSPFGNAQGGFDIGAFFGEFDGQDIIVRGCRHCANDPTNAPGTIPSPPVVLAGSPGFETGLPRDPAKLAEMLEDAKRNKDKKLIKRIERQQKMIDQRNKGKERGLGKFRSWWLFIISPVIENELRCGGSNPDPSCNIV